jgi:hypothetical protein
MVQTWNGLAWTTQGSNVDETLASELHAVSCAAKSTCAAVGLTGWSAGARSSTGTVAALAEIRSDLSFPRAGNPVEAPTGQNATTAGVGSAQTGIAGSVQTSTGGVAASHVKAVRCKVPRLTGHTLRHAKSLLSKAHCTLGRVTRSRHAAAKLVVRHQSHTAGARLTASMKVNLTLGPARLTAHKQH